MSDYLKLVFSLERIDVLSTFSLKTDSIESDYSLHGNSKLLNIYDLKTDSIPSFSKETFNFHLRKKTLTDFIYGGARSEGEFHMIQSEESDKDNIAQLELFYRYHKSNPLLRMDFSKNYKNKEGEYMRVRIYSNDAISSFFKAFRFLLKKDLSKDSISSHEYMKILENF